MTKLKYFAMRSLQTLAILFLITTFLFFFFRMMPGDITALMLQQGASVESVAAFEKKWGLNEPLINQYISYIRNMLQLDLGTSLQFQVPVWEYTRLKILNSFLLIGPAITVGYIGGSIIGTILGGTDKQWLDKMGMWVAIFIGTIPIFFLGILAILFFSLQLDWFPTSGMVSWETSNRLSDAPWWRVYFTQDFLIHYVLPFSVIAFRYTYLPTLIMRTNIDEVLDQGFTYYHRVTGLPKWKKFGHLARHASLPVITYYPLSMTRAIGGMVLIEVVFDWPGIGQALVQAVLFRDLPVVQFVFVLVAVFVVLGNFFVDILYGLIDPRVSVDE